MTQTTSRRNVVRGVAWSVPAVSMVVAAPVFAASTCTRGGGITVGPNQTTDYRAICASQSQLANPATIKQVYGNGELPRYIDVCACDAEGWYRWRETDTLSNFQIEVNGLHVDQNGPNQGFRPAFWLNLDNDCRRFNLSYRTSAERSKTQRTNFAITWTLQRLVSGTPENGVWEQAQTVSRNVSLIRTVGSNNNDQTDFNQCSSQGRTVVGNID